MANSYNKVTMSGRLMLPTYSHEVAGEVFYKSMICSRRLSGVTDTLPVIIPGCVAETVRIDPGEYYLVHAMIYSRDDKTCERTKLRVYLMANKIVPIRGSADCNSITLEGYICKGPLFRQSKLGKEICQFTVAVNNGDSSYYIPCVAFGPTTKRLEKYRQGDLILIAGRVQSREYLTSDFREGITYEIAVQSAN